jgi:hypothetical protein
MKLMPKQLKKVLAYHESGHAVVARVLGSGFTYATILSPDDTAAAAVQTESATYHARDADQNTQLDALMRDMVVCLAGPHAQARHRPPKGRGTPDEWDSDRNNAENLSLQAVLVKRGVNLCDIDIKTLNAFSPEDEAEAAGFFRQAAHKARDLVAEHWPAITRVAEALLKSHILSQDDVDQLIDLPHGH